MRQASGQECLASLHATGSPPKSRARGAYLRGAVSISQAGDGYLPIYLVEVLEVKSRAFWLSRVSIPFVVSTLRQDGAKSRKLPRAGLELVIPLP